MAEAQDVDTLKRRGRRRLVGAIALVLLAVIVLPMVFDAEPRKGAPPVSVRVPGEDDTPFTPKVTPKAAPAAKSEAPAPRSEAPAAKSDTPAARTEAPVAKSEAPRKEPAAKPEPKAETAASGKPAESGTQYMVPVGAYANPEKVVARLAEAKIPYFTEPAKGKVVRVRAGPFASKEAADKAAEKLKGLGFTPGNATPRS